jgi:hypothetical protein
MQLSALNACNSPDELTAQSQDLPPDLNKLYQHVKNLPGRFFRNDLY